MVQDVLVTIDALVHSDVLPLWRTVLGYQARADTPEEKLQSWVLADAEGNEACIVGQNWSV
ncbi:hypothetical protein GCM10009616_37920 [Microlunatus lacustris]